MNQSICCLVLNSRFVFKDHAYGGALCVYIYIYIKDNKGPRVINKEQSHMVTYSGTNNTKLEQPHKTLHCKLSIFIWHHLVFH